MERKGDAKILAVAFLTDNAAKFDERCLDKQKKIFVVNLVGKKIIQLLLETDRKILRLQHKASRKIIRPQLTVGKKFAGSGTKAKLPPVSVKF